MSLIYAVLLCTSVYGPSGDLVRNDCRNDLGETYSDVSDCRAALDRVGRIASEQSSGRARVSRRRACYSISAPTWVEVVD